MTWSAQIVAARKRKAFTYRDKCLVGSWQSCAIGEKLHLIDDAFDFAIPGYSLKLDRLGMRFMNAVERDQVEIASKLLKAIQKA